MELVFRITAKIWCGASEQVESGGGAGPVLTVVLTEYGPCACSPMGKVKRVSLPHAPGETPKWTTYAYDALGRTLSVSLPDGAGSTTYAYAKDAVTITDAAGKWKRYETNGLGELVKVVEPNPAGGANLETTYAYNLRGQLTSAVMTRGGVTQTRSFQYDLATGHLLSVTKPETGTTSYVYNADGTVQHVTDAKNQRTTFTYDSLKRLTAVRRSVWNGSSYLVQGCQDVDYVYDSLSGGGSNLWGRLAQVMSKFCNDAVYGGYRERYSYRSSGELTWRLSDWLNTTFAPLGATLRVEATYNVMGQMTNYGYGWPGAKMYSYAISYDAALRPVNLSGESLALVDLVTYNAAGAVTGFQRQDTQSEVVTNSYTFNSLFQMTGQTVVRGSTTLQNLTYAYSATQNNGQLQSQTDALSGEVVVYQYDQLNRLTSAETQGSGGWGLNFTYDGFGNKTNQTVTKGSAPTHSLVVNPANNRINMTGYSYDANGNMTAMPLTTMTYDIANRMVESVHQTAGTTRYGYNHANQRVFQHTSSTAFGTLNRRFSLYGFGGELLLEANRTGTGVQPHTGEVVRYVYFLGRKMFASVNRGPLRAAVPNRLGSRSEHFPYGELKGAAPPEGDKTIRDSHRVSEFLVRGMPAVGHYNL